MDVEKLIRRLRNDADAYRNGETLGRAFADQEDVLDNAATALSMLQAENEKLRAGLEQAKRCIEIVENQRDQMKREKDAAIDCIYKIEDALDRGNDNDWAREYISEWES